MLLTAFKILFVKDLITLDAHMNTETIAFMTPFGEKHLNDDFLSW